MSHQVPNANIPKQLPKHRAIYKCNYWELELLDFTEYRKVTGWKILESSKDYGVCQKLSIPKSQTSQLGDLESNQLLKTCSWDANTS